MNQIALSLLVLCFFSEVMTQNVLMGDKTEEFIRSIELPLQSNTDTSSHLDDDNNEIQTIGFPSALNLNSQLAPGFVINSSTASGIMLPTLQGSAPVYVNPGISPDNYYFNDHQAINPLDPAYKKKLLQTRNIIQTMQDGTRSSGNFLSEPQFPMAFSVNNGQMLGNVNSNSLLHQNPYQQLNQFPTLNMPNQMGALNGL